MVLVDDRINRHLPGHNADYQLLLPGLTNTGQTSSVCFTGSWDTFSKMRSISASI